MNRFASDYAQAFQGMEDRAVFDKIYKERIWQAGDTLSGVASQKNEYTSTVSAALPVLIEKYGIRTIADVPCGDTNWIFQPLAGTGIERYDGYDISEFVIDFNLNKPRPFAGISFKQLDIVREELPRQADLVICRDLLIHYGNDKVRAILGNLSANGSRYYLLSNNAKSLENVDLTITGDYRPHNLMVMPFNLPPPLEVIPEKHWFAEDVGRNLSLWTHEQISKALLRRCVA